MASTLLLRKDPRPIVVAPRDVLCFMCVRNESVRLPYCLSYHRRLGISRFFVVDNDSTDDTLPWLIDQPDVHVWHAAGSFAAARCGTDWIEHLLRAHGEHHWCLVVDADELFCYPDCETRSIPDLCDWLDQAGQRAFLAILLDMYSDKPIKDTRYRRGQDFLDVCGWFDRRFYHFKTDRFFGYDRHPSVFGGVRQRVFGGKEPGGSENHFYCLNKVPLIKYDRSLVLSPNLHWAQDRDVAAETGCLLHFKYFASFVEQAAEEARRQEHWRGALQYVQYAEAIRRHPDLTLFDGSRSVHFRNSQQLVECGIMHRNDPSVSSEPLPDAPPARSADGTRQLIRQVRELIASHKQSGEHPHELGVALLKQGNLNGAEAAFRRAIAQHPEFSWSQHNLGDVLALQRRWEEATAAFRRAIELNPHFALSHSNLGDLLMKQAHRQEAIAAYRTALQLQPDLFMTAKSLARALAESAREHVEESKRWYGRAHELNPDDPEIHAEAASLRPVDPDLCLQFADALAAKGQHARAIVFYQLALLARPDDSHALVQLARVLSRANEPQRALACCRRAIAGDPGESGAHTLLGDLLAEHGSLDEAIDAYRTAGELEATSAAIPKRLGDLLARAGRIDEAGAAYARAVELGHKHY